MDLWTRRDQRRAWCVLVSIVVLSSLTLASAPATLAGPGSATPTLSNHSPPVATQSLHLASSQSVALTSVKNLTPNRMLSPLFYGVNIRTQTAFTSADALALEDTSALTWRFPGGTIAETYNYTTDKNMTTHKVEPNNVSNFVGLCVQVGCRAILQLPAEIDVPATDAYYVQWIEHWLNYTVNGVSEEGFTPWLWEFGNEPAKWANFGRPWSSWLLGLKNVSATPSTYAAIVPSIVSAIRSVDPTTPIDPLGGAGGLPTADPSWVYAVMSAAQTTVQYISIHDYPESSHKATSNDSFYTPADSGAYDLNVLIPSLYAKILAACANCTKVGLLISEAGASDGSTNSNYEMGFPMAMWDATEVIQSAAENLSSIDFFAYDNSYPGSFMVTTGIFDPAYFLFKDITTFLGSNVLNVTLSSNDSGRLQVGSWWGSGDNWSVLLVNLDTQNSTTVTIVGSGFPVHGNIEYYTWNGTTPEPVGNATSWMNTTTVSPNSLELITVSPLAPVPLPSAPSGLFVLSYNGTQANLTYVQPPGPVVDDSISYGTPSFVAPYCTGPYVVVSAGEATSGMVVPDLNPANWYCFAAQAWTTTGGGPLSHFVNVTTIYPPPTGLTRGAYTTATVALSWNHASAINGMTVYQANDSGGTCGTYSAVQSLGVVSSSTVTNLTSAHAYCFEVSQHYVAGVESNRSNVVNVTTLPLPPTNVSASPASKTSMWVNWTNPHGNLTDDYVFFEQGHMCTAAKELPSAGVNNSYLVPGLTSGTQYCFYVEAVDAGGPSLLSPIGTNVTDQVPGIPIALTTTAVGTTTIAFSWKNPGGGGVVNDTLYVGGVGCEFTQVVSLGVITNAVASLLSPATTYCFAVQAWNLTGGSNLSSPLQATTLPTPPTGLNVTSHAATTLSLAWANPGGSLTDDYLFWELGTNCSSATKIDLGRVEESATLTAGVLPGDHLLLLCRSRLRRRTFGAL